MLTPKEILKKYWGYDDFRSLQSQVIDSIINKKDTIALLHTGAGKSLCYQLPAIYFSGKTVVISPLIALMQDQVAGLHERGIDARAIYAGMSKKEVDITIDNFVHGPVKILYLSPERASTEIFIERFKRADISLIAIDEAHCISQWGYDFRPSYFSVSDLRKWKPEVPMIAVTATATPQVVDDISEKLSLSDPTVFTSTFARENISLSVLISERKEALLLDILSKMSGVGIIYLRSRKRVKQIADWLTKQGYNADYYHGGLTMKTRKRIQDRWQASTDQLIVCTNAFGMGVDKSNVRFVLHLDVPPSIEEYYQEAGRAGRDGKSSYAISLISHGDIMRLEKNTLMSYPPVEDIKSVYDQLCSYLKVAYGGGVMESFSFNLENFCDRYELSKSKVHSILTILEKEGWLQLSEGYKNPSTLMITTDKKNISLSSRNRGIKSDILMHLIRSYEGLFIDYAIIDEEKISKFIGVDVYKVKRELQVMDRELILRYKPAEGGAKITLLQDRPNKDSFTIDEKSYQFRVDRAMERKQSIVSYMLSKSCRQQQLLAYFDEKSKPCGICDVCKGAFDTEYSITDRNEIVAHISKSKGKTIPVENYLLEWPYNRREKVKACLRSLENEGFITIDDKDQIILS